MSIIPSDQMPPFTLGHAGHSIGQEPRVAGRLKYQLFSYSHFQELRPCRAPMHQLPADDSK
jgi:hypothetical protein